MFIIRYLISMDPEGAQRKENVGHRHRETKDPAVFNASKPDHQNRYQPLANQIETTAHGVEHGILGN